MKYTRYNIKQKRKSKGSFFLYLVITLLTALLLGTGLSFMFNKGSEGKLDAKTVESNEKTNKEQGENKGEPNHQFYLLQCGVFKVKENAEALRKTVEPLGSPFIVQEGELFRVYFGVYSKEQWEPVYNMLKEKGINTTKSVIDVYYDDLSTGELCQIIEANFKIVNKASEQNIKGVKTNELKTWASSLQAIEEDKKHYKDVVELKEYIKGLPEEVDKTKVSEIISITYDKIKQFKK
ncbi:SPOR domain-containing protein [Clostridium tunisiense]|uniref:SPOR domain-containing protein n=1 Tax=Clostridium tunisiense TaxID=219748 RepID=UPI00031ACC2F|nr:SPOR domain-containing protein [Clostridium tunisiense]